MNFNTVQVAPYELFEAMDPAGSGEIDIAALMQSYWDVEYRGASRDPSRQRRRGPT